MKKVFLFLTAFAFTIGFSANAQTFITPGIKAGANVSNYILKDLSGADSNMKAGASVSSFVNFEFSEWFSLQPEIGFHYRNSEFKGTGKKNDMEYWGADLLVYSTGQMTFNNGGKIYLGLGPYVGYGFSLKNTSDDINLYKEDQMKRFDFGAALLLGYEFRFGLQVNASYKTGFLDLTDKALGKMRTQVVGLGVGYRF